MSVSEIGRGVRSVIDLGFTSSGSSHSKLSFCQPRTHGTGPTYPDVEV